MQPTSSSHINDVLNELLARLRAALGDKLVGLYLYGSHVTGGFDEISDLDLLAALTSDIDEADLERLRRLHADFIVDHPVWDDRIEVAYLSVAALQTFKERRSPLGIISPGEPLHIIDAGPDWLMNWYLVRTGGKTLFGPPPAEIIAPVSREEFVESIREHARAWPGWIEKAHDRHYQAYAVLTMCRTLYTHRTGEHVSKQDAAAWAQQAMPEWAGLIQDALVTRKSPKSEVGDSEATLPVTARFVHEVRKQIDGA